MRPIIIWQIRSVDVIKERFELLLITRTLKPLSWSASYKLLLVLLADNLSYMTAKPNSNRESKI